MSLIWILLEKGMSQPVSTTWGQRVTYWCGRRLAMRHRSVTIPPDCLVHPDARLHPRGHAITMGGHCVIASGAVVQGPVTMGHHCSVQTGSIVIGCGDGKGPITLGNHVRIAPFAQLIAGNHDISNPEGPIGKVIGAPITIGDNVWVAGRVIITAGVTVGRNSVLAAGSVVTKDVPPYSIVGGVPAKVIRSRKVAE